jgi:iron complex transport system ATP-binding protein
MLEVIDLQAGYDGKVVLKGVSFTLAEGSILAVIGPNGAGKSTLIRALSGVIPVLGGSLRYDGRDLSAMPAQERARLLAVVPQARSLPGSFTAWEVVLLGRTPYLNWLGQVSARDEELTAEAMRRTRTDELAQRRVSELSGGELQRLLLARALVQATPVLALDEPTAHLDLRYQIEMLDQVRALVHGGRNGSGHHPLSGLAVLHDLNLVARYADRILLLVDGRVRALGTRDEVLRADLLSEAYQISLEVIQRPRSGEPVILPLSPNG